MISFEQQKKILAPILQKPTNKKCADCGSATPTWASLDFGVFVCSNCSGAHRALGPTVTRIKSTTLDRWSKQWFSNMVLGNDEINLYWEADATAAAFRKPKSGAPLDDYNRYIVQKYIKKKFVSEKTALHPLQQYKKGNYQKPEEIQNPKTIIPQKPSITIHSQAPSIVSESRPRSNNFSLLDDHEEQNIQIPTRQGNIVQHPQDTLSAQKNFSSEKHDDDQFDEYVQAVPHQLPNTKSEHDPSKISFDDLFKSPKMETHQSHNGGSYNNNLPQNHQLPQHHNNMYPTHSQGPNTFNGANMHMNNHMNYLHPNNMQRGFSTHHQGYGQMQQGGYNNFNHNPYVGYVPHQHGSNMGMQPHYQQHSYSPQPNQNGQYSNITLN